MIYGLSEETNLLASRNPGSGLRTRAGSLSDAGDCVLTRNWRCLKFELFVTRFTDGIRFDPTPLSADHCTDEAAKELLSRLDKKIQNIRRTRIHAV